MSPHSTSVLIAILPILASLVITLATGFYTMSRSHINGARSFAVSIFLGAFWIIGFLVEMLEPTLKGKIFWDNIQWIATLLIPLAWLSFTIEYSGIRLNHLRATWAALFVVPVLTILLIFTDPFPGMTFQSVQLVSGSPFSEYTYQFGPLLWVAIIFTYLIVLGMLYLLARLASQQRDLYRMQTIIILVGICTPILGSILSLLNVNISGNRDLSPYTFAIGNLIISLGLFRYRIFDILPFARDAVVDKMEEGVIILDDLGRLVDINPAARDMMGWSNLLSVGQPVTSGLPKWLQEINHDLNQKTIRQEYTFRNGHESRTVDLQITRLESPHGAFSGYLVILHDITESKLVETTLENAYALTQQQVAERTVELSRMNRTLTMINECNQALIRMDDEQDLLDAICKIIVEKGSYLSAWIGPDELSTSLHTLPSAYYGSGQTCLSLIQSILKVHRTQVDPSAGERANTKLPVITYDIRNDQELEPFREEALQLGILAVITAPLGYAAEYYGNLAICSAMPYEYDEKEIELLNKLINNVSYGVHTRRVGIARDMAEQQADRAAVELYEAYESTLEGWSKALELREVETAEHSQRVVDWTLALARKMGTTEEECIHIRRGALLHDIGKMGVPDSILLKPTGLTDDDWKIMRQHPVRARELLTSVHYLEPALVIPYYHHERWDGSGYPLGLKGEEIPRAARIFAVIDAWDALLYDRPYRKGWPRQKVLDYLESNAGKLFDPEVVASFLEMMKAPAPAAPNLAGSTPA